jgi:7-cyano-7-deazaguanine tRNA-ribosyltransferase
VALRDIFEIKVTDLGGRIGKLTTKTGSFETPALLPVIHPVSQLVPCFEIRSMGYEAVMTNAYTVYKRLAERAKEGIHRIIGFEGSIMTDSGGYQVLEYGGIEITPLQIAEFEEKIGTDIAIILDEPTGLDVTRSRALATIRKTLESAKATKEKITNSGTLWTVPIQGGRYLDLVARSARASRKLGYDCYALGSPVEVMEDYDFSLLVQMILASKRNLAINKPFHLFGAGHPLVIPLAVMLGCDMFDSASYMLYAKQDRYISPRGTIRLEQLEYLACPCKICSSFKLAELKSISKEKRTVALARHNLAVLRQIIEETKQAIWEGRLWEYVQSNSRNHPKGFEAFRTAVKNIPELENGTPTFKNRGIFISEPIDLERPEVTRFRKSIAMLNLKGKKRLIIVPETKTKPFLLSELYFQIARLAHDSKTLIAVACPDFGLVPAEISDIFPVSQTTSSYAVMPNNDPILKRNWQSIYLLATKSNRIESWLSGEMRHSRRNPGNLVLCRTYSSLKRQIAQV